MTFQPCLYTPSYKSIHLICPFNRCLFQLSMKSCSLFKVCQLLQGVVFGSGQAFDQGPWPRLSGRARGQVLYKLANLIQQHAQELAVIESLDNGKPFKYALHADVALVCPGLLNFVGRCLLQSEWIYLASRQLCSQLFLVKPLSRLKPAKHGLVFWGWYSFSLRLTLFYVHRNWSLQAFSQ